MNSSESAGEATGDVDPIDRATTLYELGRFLSAFPELSSDAERHFRAALDADPKHARSLSGLGTLRASAAKYAEAMPLFEQAVAAIQKQSDELASMLNGWSDADFRGEVDLFGRGACAGLREPR